MSPQCVNCDRVLLPNEVAWTPTGGDPHCSECAGLQMPADLRSGQAVAKLEGALLFKDAVYRTICQKHPGAAWAVMQIDVREVIT